MITTAQWKCALLSSQVGPVQGEGHAHEYPVEVIVQVPPLLQGALRHSLTSDTRTHIKHTYTKTAQVNNTAIKNTGTVLTANVKTNY